MDKIITYIIYSVVALAFYILIRAAFVGNINANTTLGNTAKVVEEDTIHTLKNLPKSTSSFIRNTQTNKTPSAM